MDEARLNSIKVANENKPNQEKQVNINPQQQYVIHNNKLIQKLKTGRLEILGLVMIQR